MSAAIDPRVWLMAMVSIGLSAAAQLLMKVGMAQLAAAGRLKVAVAQAVLDVLLNPFVFGGLACYAVSAAVWLLVLAQMPLSLAYPLIALGIATVVLLSWLLLGEPVGSMRLAGIVLIVGGVSLIGIGGARG